MDDKYILTNLKKNNMKAKNINETYPFVIIELENEKTKERKFAIGCMGVKTRPKYENYKEAREAILNREWEVIALLTEAITRAIVFNNKKTE